MLSCYIPSHFYQSHIKIAKIFLRKLIKPSLKVYISGKGVVDLPEKKNKHTKVIIMFIGVRTKGVSGEGGTLPQIIKKK